jgi:indolepyruvate ferredoxin oxidoreductase, beta subunit
VIYVPGFVSATPSIKELLMIDSHNHDLQAGHRLVIAGTGGQGVITAASLLCDFFTASGHDVVSGQAHGMSQRGGTVQATVSVDAGPSPQLPRGSADSLVALEPVEAVRALPLLSSSAVVVMNTATVRPYVLAQQAMHDADNAEYPDLESLEGQLREVTPHVFSVNGSDLAEHAGSLKTLNVVMLGCLFGAYQRLQPEGFPYSQTALTETIAENASPQVADSNLRAFASGLRAIGELDDAVVDA